ncbi:FHA domain-containing protein [Mycobacterium sp. E2733]|uniref:FHA domain-containing protein n=1 Tax=Mycobacterium sp. E2733 TaxID=1834138 RepID=UPI000A5F3489|nr:FHA domain-containing protein [Mycobacterium sp. E2733]
MAAIASRGTHFTLAVRSWCYCVNPRGVAAQWQLSDRKVSRHHAVIVDTGTSLIINDLRSSNGVHVQHERIRSAATLRDGDHVRICDHEFTFEIAADDESAPS